MRYYVRMSRSTFMKDRWASMTPAQRSKVMSERRKKGAASMTPEARSESARVASKARWDKWRKEKKRRLKKAV